MILKKGPGDRLSAGLAIDSPFRPLEKEAGEPRSVPPLRLIPGCPRPMQTGRVLKGVTILVVGAIETLSTDLGEKPLSKAASSKDTNGDAPSSMVQSKRSITACHAWPCAGPSRATLKPSA